MHPDPNVLTKLGAGRNNLWHGMVAGGKTRKRGDRSHPSLR